jgi:acyl dehydratase
MNPRTCLYEEIALETSESWEYIISPEVYDHFLRAFDDRSPIHVDGKYAESCGYPGPVMHGSILNGFLSHFVGMYFPGRFSLLLSADIRFAQPSYLGDTIRLEARVSQKLDVSRVVILDVNFQNITRDYLAARGRIQVMLRKES